MRKRENSGIGIRASFQSLPGEDVVKDRNLHFELKEKKVSEMLCMCRLARSKIDLITEMEEMVNSRNISGGKIGRS